MMHQYITVTTEISGMSRVAELTPTRAISADGSLNGEKATLGLYVDNTNERYKADHELYTLNESVWSFTKNGKDDAQVLFNGCFDWIAYSPYSIRRKNMSPVSRLSSY